MLVGVRKETPMYPKTYETLAQAAERTGVTVKTLRRWISSGRLPAFRYGARLIRVEPKEVDRLMCAVRPVHVGAQ